VAAAQQQHHALPPPPVSGPLAHLHPVVEKVSDKVVRSWWLAGWMSRLARHFLDKVDVHRLGK
jgi:hypothetical protein